MKVLLIVCNSILLSECYKSGCWLFLCSRWHSPRQSLCKAPDVLPVTNWISLLFFHSWTCWCMRSLYITCRKISRDVEKVQGCPSSLCTVSHIGQGNSKTKSSEIMLTCILYLLLAWTFNISSQRTDFSYGLFFFFQHVFKYV